MATGEQPNPLKSKKVCSSSGRTRIDSDTQWLLLPNNLELGARARPSKKQRNKEKHKQLQQENVSPSEVVDGLSCKPRSSYHALPHVKSNTASWIKDQYINEEKSKRRVYESDEEYSESDYQFHQQNVHLPTNQAFPDLEHQEHPPPPSRSTSETENIKSVNGEFKKKETAMFCEILTHIQEFISEAESSWQKLDLTDEPVIKDAFVKLKNAVKDVEGDRENKLMLHNSATENGYANGVSPSSSTSRISSSKENIVNRDASGSATFCVDDDGQDKCNHLHEVILSDEKRDSISSDDCAIADVGERVAAVEWERRKLKNKLVELQEEKKMLRELCYLKDAANTASGDSQLQKAKDKKKKKLCKLQSPSQNIKVTKGPPPEDNQNVILDSDTPVLKIGSRHPRSSLKRDNVRKEQNSSFPARRHYEAEGRANEDPDIPAATTATAEAVSPILDNPGIQDKIRKLKVAQQHVKVIKDIVVSILESRKAGGALPVDHLCLLTPMQKTDQYFSEESEEGSDLEKEFPSAVHPSNSEPLTGSVKEVCCDGIKSSLLDVDSHIPGDTEEAVADNLETVVGKKEDLIKLQSHYQQLMQIFPSTDRRNDDPVRSSGEGGNILKKVTSRNVVPENMQKMQSVRTVPHQDNLQLTRQNIVTLESQNQNSNSNFHNRDCNSVKKDNINNLSGKMGKLSIQNSMNSSYPDVVTASNNNIDSMSSFSYELNQNHSLSNEVERKTILDILKRVKKKQKQYDRNHDSKMCCNSSIDSETLEDSNSAFAVDSTTLAAWGGSSTQENFEDENEEHAGSLEDDDEEEESVSVFDKGSVGGHRPSTQFSNMQHYIESVTNNPDKRQRNFHQPVFSRNQNHSGLQSGYQLASQPMKSVQQPVSSPNAVSGLPRELHENSVCANDNAEHCHQHLPTKFIQQLKNHVDQLNALCQNQIYHERPQTNVNSHLSQNCTHIPNACTPPQNAPEIPLPYNQQLLLCLSQCYHALYMQQLEIHHLQRCIWHNYDGENSHQQCNVNSRGNHEDSSFHPHYMPPWPNLFNPSNHLLLDQVSPLSSAAYFPLPVKHHSNHNGSSYAAGSGTQPARAVIHPTSQSNASTQETLNNQVPPRTRANNFWDNFRSYSRQNLLSSSSNVKRNENVTPLVTPQVRQVYPLVTNGSPNRTTDTTNTCCSSSSFSEDTSKAGPMFLRAASNPEETLTKNIIRNAPIAGATSFQKKDVPTNVNFCSSRNMRFIRSQRVNLEPPVVRAASTSYANLEPPVVRAASTSYANLEPPVVRAASTSSANSVQQQSLPQENSKVGTAASIAPNFVSNCRQDSAPEISNLMSNDHKSDFLIGLFHEAQALKSETMRQKALKMIKDLAMSEKQDGDDHSQNKAQNDRTHSPAELERDPIPLANQHCSKGIDETSCVSPEKTGLHLPSDIASGNIQNLPTAAISPLSSHNGARAINTGAVRKKPKILSACIPDPVSNSRSSSHESSGSTTDSIEPLTAVSSNKTVEDIPAFVTEKVISDLNSVLPSLKRGLLRDGCSQSFWTFISDCLLESLKTHLFFCNINLSRKCMFHLRQTIYHFLSLFSGMTLADIDSDFVKYVEEFVFENMTCFLTSGQFAPVPSSLGEENCSTGIDDKMQELNVKMPIETSETISMKKLVKVQEELTESTSSKLSTRMPEDVVEPSIKAPLLSSDENGAFSVQFGPPQPSILSFDNCIPEASILAPGPILPEPEPESGEDLRCDCNPEAEIEPEVEIGTEADLAEADQSPGQQGSGAGEAVPLPENWTLENCHEAVLLHRNVDAIMMINGDENRVIDDSSDGASGVQLPTSHSVDQEVILDDIPTKLCASEEELPQQLKDEQSVLLPSEDVISHGDFSTENNSDGGLSNFR